MSEKWTWFLDESYQVPNSQNRNTFYIFGGVQLSTSKIEEFENGMKQTVKGNYWHTTEAMRTRNGISKYFEIAEFIRNNLEPFCFSHSPIDLNDKLGESSRSQLIREILFKSAPSTDLIFEARPRGFQMESDLRILQENRRKFAEFQSREVRFERTSGENCLWAADLVAYSARQSILGKTQLSFETLFK